MPIADIPTLIQSIRPCPINALSSNIDCRPSRAAISLLERGIWSFKEGQGWRSPDAQERLLISMVKKSSEKIRNAAIMIYMVGNALTFTKLWSMELANLQETGQLGGKMVKALLLSFVWPFYWIGRMLFG